MQIRKHKSKATETEKRKAYRKRWLLLYGNLILRFIAGQDIEVFRDIRVGNVVQRKARELTDDLHDEIAYSLYNTRCKEKLSARIEELSDAADVTLY